jgi:hypothetical protein
MGGRDMTPPEPSSASWAAEAAPAASLALRPSVTWFSDAVRVLRNDLHLYARTALAFSLRPARFASEWRDQRRRALNPLAFLGTALALGSPISLIISHFVAGNDQSSDPWKAFLFDQIGPYAQYAVLGLLAHGFLRLLGGRSPLLATMGIVLFAGGGPALIVDLATQPLDIVLGRAAASEDTTATLWLAALTITSIAAANLAFFVSFARGLAGLHGVGTWRPFLALSAAYLVIVGLRYGFYRVLEQPWAS